MIIRRVEYKVRPGQPVAVRRILSDFLAAIREKEPGTVMYDAFASNEEPTHFFHLMVFTDEAAQKAHQTSRHCQKFVAALYPLCARVPDFTDWKLMASKETRLGPLPKDRAVP